MHDYPWKPHNPIGSHIMAPVNCCLTAIIHTGFLTEPEGEKPILLSSFQSGSKVALKRITCQLQWRWLGAVKE